MPTYYVALVQVVEGEPVVEARVIEVQSHEADGFAVRGVDHQADRSTPTEAGP
jgi:hypothetical protein